KGIHVLMSGLYYESQEPPPSPMDGFLTFQVKLQVVMRFPRGGDKRRARASTLAVRRIEAARGWQEHSAR
ncbi:MAG: hypothetical protein OXE51_07595, partial [Gammaproteobacteria bacterium]|nr:hypothetical protein [Gammaproteobacteria bacterium]